MKFNIKSLNDSSFTLMGRVLIRTAVVFVVVVIIANIFLDNPTFVNLSDKADFELQANKPELAQITRADIVKKDFYNMESHYQYINAHFDIPERQKIGRSKYKYRDDTSIMEYYDSWMKDENSDIADIGFYGKGLIQAHLENDTLAIAAFLHVKNKQLKYLNNSIGNAYNKLGEYRLAEFYFRIEIDNNGNLDGAYHNLIQLLLKQDRLSELCDLFENSNTKKYFSLSDQRKMYFRLNQPVAYIYTMFKLFFTHMNITGVVAAFLIMCIWIMYLRRLDIFELEKWSHVIIVVLMGMLFSFLTNPLYDFDNAFFGFNLNGGLVNDFFYSIIGIGAIEEFVKIIPLLLMMRFTKVVDEPFDYIKYASLSALGFSFIENIMYFNESSLHVIHGRALTSVVLHMFLSSIIAYGIILNKYKNHRNPYLNFIVFFVLASVLHGFYDFWLINKLASNLSILSTFTLLVGLYVWSSFINNALNHSTFYDKDKSIDKEKIQSYLVYSLIGVLLFEYVVVAFKFGPSLANGMLFMSFATGGVLLLAVISASLSTFSIVEGQWGTIKYAPPEEVVDYGKVIGLELKLSRFTPNDYASQFLPNSGKIAKLLTVSNESDWYLMKIDVPAQFNTYLSDLVLMKTKEKGELIEKGEKRLVSFYIIPSDVNLDAGDLKRTDFKFCGWATLKS